ncbi:hypothetical protein [Halobaculum marinum]|uniref:Uncharacterized protein n=1 Tax=Halobaculum marinum TaxID=3031996 RepID=A0ABD5X1N7_9EURY|nr:hypothetical protein [Halobaculum sp. DT55]
MNQESETDGGALDQLAGVTGFGWTASVLGYLGTAIGFGNTLVTNPQSLLYLGGICFLATLGIDRLNDLRSDGTDTPDDAAGDGDCDGVAEDIDAVEGEVDAPPGPGVEEGQPAD